MYWIKRFLNWFIHHYIWYEIRALDFKGVYKTIYSEICNIISFLHKGYRESDTFDLGATTATYLLPRLKEYRRISADPDYVAGFPTAMYEENFDYTEPNYEDKYPEVDSKAHAKWLGILDAIIWSLEVVANDDDHDIKKYGFDTGDFIADITALNNKIQFGLELLGKYLRYIWW